MKLHANAALSLNQRRRMVRRVVEQGWSLSEAAEAAEVSERTCSKWVRSLPRTRATPGCWTGRRPRGRSRTARARSALR